MPSLNTGHHDPFWLGCVSLVIHQADMLLACLQELLVEANSVRYYLFTSLVWVSTQTCTSQTVWGCKKQWSSVGRMCDGAASSYWCFCTTHGHHTCWRGEAYTWGVNGGSTAMAPTTHGCDCQCTWTSRYLVCSHCPINLFQSFLYGLFGIISFYWWSALGIDMVISSPQCAFLLLDSEQT